MVGMKEYLKPCPFCGGKADAFMWNMSSYWSIGCFHDECLFMPHKSNCFENKKDAIKSWNTRNNK